MDAITIIEAAYAEAPSLQDWMDGLLQACKPHFEHGFGLAAWTFDARNPHALQIEERRYLGEKHAYLEYFERGSEMLAKEADDPRVRGHLQPFSTATSVIGRERLDRFMASIDPAAGARDMFALIGADPTGRGIGIGSLAREPRTPSRPEVRCWSRVAAHLAAGFRLRQRASGDGDAVLEPGGKVAHAEGEARSAGAREALVRAALDVDRARGQLRRDDNDGAVEAWRGLVSGRWSLVERFENDGRRYLIARKNDPRVGLIPLLSEREQQVLLFRVFGHPLKLIAYELGLSVPTVSRALSGAMKKLGLHSPSDLIALLGAGPSA